MNKLNKSDKEFLKKIAKKADEAHALATKAAQEAELKKLAIKPQIDTTTILTEPKTGVHAVFETNEDLRKNAPQIQVLNNHVHKFCTKLNLRELQINYKREDKRV